MPRATLCSLHQWASELTQRYKAEITFTSDFVVALDWEVVELVFYDAFTNAKKYGHPDKKPWVQLLIHNDRDALLVNVCNVPCPGAPDITTEMAATILDGGKGVGNEGGAQNDSIRTSDGIGILNARKSVEALGGELRMYQERTGNGIVTTMQIQAPFKRFNSSDEGNAPSTSSAPLDGTDISNAAPDPKKPTVDSITVPVPKKMNSAISPSDIGGPTVQLGPPLPTVMTSSTTAGHHEPTTAGPKCFSLDDAPSLLKQYNRMLHKHLKASESLVAGTNRAEVEAAVDIAMGRTMPSLEPASVVVPADIVTLDYDLGHPQLVGTDIAAQLQKEGFKGLVCMLSGGSSEDLEALLHMPGVDMARGKEVRLKALAPMLLENYQKKMGTEAGKQ